MKFASRPLLDLARGAPCQLRIPGVCNRNPETTVSCHANLQEFGKGFGIKASDAVHCHGCSDCHTWLDQGKASKVEKTQAFLLGVARTMDYLFSRGLVAVAGSKVRETTFQPLPKMLPRDAYRQRAGR